MPCKHGSGQGHVSFVIVEVLEMEFLLATKHSEFGMIFRKGSIRGIDCHQTGIMRIRIPEDLPKDQSCLVHVGMPAIGRDSL